MRLVNVDTGVTTVQFFPHELYLLAEACDAEAMRDGCGLMPLYEALAAFFGAAMMAGQMSWQSVENERETLTRYRRQYAELAKRHGEGWSVEPAEETPPAA